MTAIMRKSRASRWESGRIKTAPPSRSSCVRRSDTNGTRTLISATRRSITAFSRRRNTRSSACPTTSLSVSRDTHPTFSSPATRAAARWRTFWQNASATATARTWCAPTPLLLPTPVSLLRARGTGRSSILSGTRTFSPAFRFRDGAIPNTAGRSACPTAAISRRATAS